jgi:lipoate-protein ligase A
MGRLRVLLFETPSDPYYNLAFEEALFLVHSKGVARDDTLRIWRNENSVVIGYFQNPYEEVDMDYARKINAHIVRRFTGGGAVYHDLGNVNYAIVTGNRGNNPLKVYEVLLEGILRGLEYLGVKPHLENINDIAIGYRKVSGTAASIKGQSWFLHGALLVSTDLERLSKILKVSRKKLMDKKVRSVKYRVTLLSSILGRRPGYWEIIDALVKGYSETLGDEPYYDLPSPVELRVASILYRGKYLRREWNMERKPSAWFKDVYEEAEKVIMGFKNA